MRIWALIVCLALPGAALAQEQGAEDVLPGVPFKEGDVIAFEEIDKLKDYLPPQFWEHREFFFYEGMKLEIGPFFRKYGAADAYNAMTAKFDGQTQLGKDGALENYTAGQPFTKIDCKGDPQAGAKIAWNFVLRWEGLRRAASFYYSYWDRGEQLPLYYEGTSDGYRLAFRTEPQFEAEKGDVFRNEKRYEASGPNVDAPFDARGIMLMTYRYKASLGPKASTKNDDTWVYVPSLRRVRRISTAQRTDAVSGTDFTFDDLFSFNGIVPQYEWQCMGQADLIAPTNTRVKGYPYERDHNFGPYGLSYADDVWELRHAVKIRFTPYNSDHPYKYKDIYIDTNSMEPLYSFAYDRKGELWKIIWHNKIWSENPINPAYKPYEGVEAPRDLTVVSDVIVNVQTGTGNRIEFWDRTGTPDGNVGKIRRVIDIGRLTKGR
jgi:hypothetical protein